MNYIKKLEADVARLQAEKAEAHECLADLYHYLASPKFNTESWVDAQDVRNRIEKAWLATM